MTDRDRHFLCMAARLALRGHGGAEPNPLVGAVIVSPQSETVGWGYHRAFGGPHAEVVALRRAGSRAAGATLYCTLEPCNHTGKTPPCTEAIITAKLARVVIARRDPNPVASDGLDRLRTAGIAVDVIDDCTEATAVSDPFAHRVRTGLPWVTVKWAQTIDGKIATRAGQSKWISNEVSRRMVHRERGRVDVVLTGIGTVLADDPMLTARKVRVRRVARRVVVDPSLKLPLESKLVRTASEVPVMVACDQMLIGGDGASRLRARGVDVVGFPMDGRELPLDMMFRELVARFDATNVLVEAGPGLMRRLFEQRLANEAWVFVAPGSMTEDHGQSPLAVFDFTGIAQQFAICEISQHQRKSDTVMRFRVGTRLASIQSEIGRGQ